MIVPAVFFSALEFVCLYLFLARSIKVYIIGAVLSGNKWVGYFYFFESFNMLVYHVCPVPGTTFFIQFLSCYIYLVSKTVDLLSKSC